MTPAPDRPFIDFVHRQRVVVGGVLLALAVGCLVVAGYCGYRGLKDSFGKAEQTPPAETDTAVKELEPLPYQVGMIAGLIAALGLGGVGAAFVGRVPPLDADARRRTDRVLLLVGGYVFGLAFRLAGLFLFVYWFDKLAAWVGGAADSKKTGWWPVAALLAFLVGAGLTFLATLPARAEERNRPWVRRAVYGVNFALSTVLLVVGLVLVNAVIATKLPEKLDTTSTGFYTLTDQTQEYAAGLKQTIRAYVVTGDLEGTPYERIQQDTLRLLAKLRQVNPSKFEVIEYAAASNGKEIQALQQQYKAAELQEFGVLLVTGKEWDRFEHVPLRRMASGGGRDGKVNFNGEAQLVSGMMALTEERMTVYYTRGSGELALERSGDPAAAALNRPAFRLGGELESLQCVARPLDIDPLKADAAVPDDAAAVLVLDPLSPLPPATVAAIQRYMTVPRAGGKKGKLLLFAGAHNAPATTPPTLAKTGLEPVLADLGIELGDRVIYSEPVNRLPPDVTLMLPTPAAARQRNPVAIAGADGLIARPARPVATAPTAGPRGTAQPLLYVRAAGATWLEKSVISPPSKAWQDMYASGQRKDAAYQRERDVNNPERYTAAAAMDADRKPVAAVFGFADGLSDEAADADGGAVGVFKAAVGWLRERPAAPDITPKEYTVYTPKKTADGGMLFTVPVFGTLIAIVLLGLGVWAVRRK